MSTGSTQSRRGRNILFAIDELAGPGGRQGMLPWFAATIVAVAASAAYVWIADWPPGTHADEIKKVAFILTGEQDFHHPILMLQTARLGNYFFGYTEVEATLRLARTISGFFGGLVVLATFVLGRLVVQPVMAVATAAAVAVTPLIVFHATFLKEDIYLAGPAIFGLAGLLILVERPSAKLALAIGLAFGVAMSAKWVALVFFTYAVGIVLVTSTDTIRRRFRHSGLMLAGLLVSFIVINAPALIDYETTLTGMDREVLHAAIGHDVLIPIWMTVGVMHLRDSLLPGLGLPLLVVGLAGLSAPAFNRARRKPLAIIAGAAFLWYLVHEASPLKPYPNFERYMVPMGPLLVVLGAAILETVFSRRAVRWGEFVAPAVLILLAVPAAYASYNIATASAHDPRRVVPQIFGSLGRQSYFDSYAAFGPQITNRLRDRTRPIEILVTSSFWYSRFERHGNDPAQSPRVRELYDRYFGRAFEQPYLELSSGGPSFGFLNPVIRIVALTGDLERLRRIGDSVIEVDPNVMISVGP